ncbi:MAG: hypothetical protein IJC41_05025 [Firmicutes bacterium]|nr:hypothetical protein [Clostridiales bacterium]MBQ4340342.1 hypothetical protein [Bacillota bacterium]
MGDKILVFLNETPEVKIAVTVLIIAAVAVIIGLLLRSTRLWYWKTDKMIDSIDEMGNRIDSIEKGMDSIKISTERLIEESRLTNEALFAIQERTLMMLEAKEEEAAKEAAALIEEISSAEPIEAETGEEIKEQVEDLERSLQELKKQKEQLEADINARIRD